MCKSITGNTFLQTYQDKYKKAAESDDTQIGLNENPNTFAHSFSIQIHNCKTMFSLLQVVFLLKTCMSKHDFGVCHKIPIEFRENTNFSLDKYSPVLVD